MHHADHRDEGPLPAGFAIYHRQVPVMGCYARRAAAIDFCRGSARALRLEPEAVDAGRAGAIRIYGSWGRLLWRRERHIGHVGAEETALLTALKLTGQVRARLLTASISAGGYIDIACQIIGPAQRAAEYRMAVRRACSSGKTVGWTGLDQLMDPALGTTTADFDINKTWRPYELPRP